VIGVYAVLVGGGPSPRQLSDGLGRRLPLASRALDWLVITASGTEQVGALPGVLERFPPISLLWAGSPQGTYDSRVLLEAVVEEGILVTPAETGQVLDLGEGVRLRVVWAGERGAVLLLEWENFRLLLPGGVAFEAFQALENGRSIGPVSALLLADGGYAPSSPPEWIENLHPQVILLSVDSLNRRGLPSPETLEAVEGYPLLRTDRNGWIQIETDGERMWVEVERR
jgi:beta-lactamase superfamily II metal-dependent hydrolase